MAVISEGIRLHLKEKEEKEKAKVKKLKRNKEKHKEELENMITGYGFENSENYIAWLDLASGIRNIEFTRELIAEISEDVKLTKRK